MCSICIYNYYLYKIVVQKHKNPAVLQDFYIKEGLFIILKNLFAVIQNQMFFQLSDQTAH